MTHWGKKTEMEPFENSVVDFQLENTTSYGMVVSKISRVLVIYTGGTIGMRNAPEHGYIPESNYFVKKLASMPQFHDLEYPMIDGFEGHFESEQDFSHLKWLITPESLYGKRIQYGILEYNVLLDSSDINMMDWIQIATDIERHYKYFDAFIVLHGTDTMAYTASALSFLLENLGKTVIITGSQVPISEVRNDGVDNLLGALTIAGHYIIPEVCLYFSNRLYRGNRCSKISAMDFEAFDSPNLSPLVKIGVNIEVNWSLIHRPDRIAKFNVHKNLNQNVSVVRIFPGISEVAFASFFGPPMEGVVLETYGAGNAPSKRPDLLRIIKEASDRGVVIVNVTQCKKGIVSDLYGTAKPLVQAHVVFGRDMTPECALTKLAYLLSKKKSMTLERCRQLMCQSLRGELTGITSLTPDRVIRNRHDKLMQIMLQLYSPRSYAVDNLNIEDNNTEQERLALEKSLYPVLLCNAAASNDIDRLKQLLSGTFKEFNINTADYDGRTALHVAASEGNLEIVQLLLLNGSGVHMLDRFGHTPLFDAVSFKHKSIVEVLVKTGAHFNDGELLEITLKFHQMIFLNDQEGVGLVLLAGLNVNQRGFNNRTALHYV